MHNGHISRTSSKQIIGKPTACLALLVLLFLSGCNGDTTNATSIVVFPTRIPAGTVLPTFGVALSATPVVATAALPTTRGTTAPTRPPATRVITRVPPTAVPPTSIPTVDANWTALATGVQWRWLSFNNSAGQSITVQVVRIDPNSVSFKVKYTPGVVRSIQDWRNALLGALVIVNASYFDPQNRAIGLVGIDGTLYGASVGRNDGGMFQVRSNAAHVRSLYLEPYSNTERFDQAVQGFPVLVAAGLAAPAFNPDVGTAADRRTVYAQDAKGRILFIVTPFSTVTLKDLANWLAVSGLELTTAVNMDGGNSTSMYLATGGPSQFTQGLKPVPVVVAVYPR